MVVRQQGKLRRNAFALLLVTAVAFGGLFAFLPRDIVVGMFVVAFVAFLYFVIAIGLTGAGRGVPQWLRAAPLWSLVFVPVVVGVGLFLWTGTDLTVFAVVFLLGMMFLFLYYWLLVPFALVQKTDQSAWDRDHELTDTPPLSVLIPAYKERGHITKTLDSLAATVYPGEVELVVVDDGSLDGTYEEARDHPTTNAVVVQKENGGKHSALNRGLAEASHDLIVSIDADSWVAPDALTRVVRAFQRHPEAGAVAGNVKVGNRHSFLTRLQAFEYVLGINTFRRAFDHVGLVSVVPGCLGAFRRETLEEIQGYSADTLTEDFDLTIEILKRDQPVHMSEGVVYTYAPATWRGLYRQRLRWFRGHVQTILKHRRVLTRSDYGLLQRLVFPYALLSMSLFPLLGLTVLVVIVLMVALGQAVPLAQLSVFFFVLVAALSLLAIEIDEEDRRLAVYAPLSVVGYKQFMDLVLLKSVVDVLSGRRLRWTSAGRIRHPESGLVYDPTAPSAGGDDRDPTFQLYEDDDGWQWRLRSPYRRTVARSASRAVSKEQAERTIDLLRKRARAEAGGETGAPDGRAPTFEVYAEDDQWRWRLRRPGGPTLVESGREYDSEREARRALERSRNRAAAADVTVVERAEIERAP